MRLLAVRADIFASSELDADREEPFVDKFQVMQSTISLALLLDKVVYVSILGTGFAAWEQQMQALSLGPSM